MSRRLARLTSWILILFLSTGPVLAGSDRPAVRLLGVEHAVARVSETPGLPPAPVLGATDAEMGVRPAARADSSGVWGWMTKFGGGVADGLVHAIPNLVKAFRDDPVKTTLMVGAMVAVGILSPPAALALGGVMATAALVEAGGDPAKTGQVVGEAGFWTLAGLGGARALRGPKPPLELPGARPQATLPSATRSPISAGQRLAAPAGEPMVHGLSTPPPRSQIRPGQRFDVLTGDPIVPGQLWHGQNFHTQTGQPIRVPATEVVRVPAGKTRLVVGGGRAASYHGDKMPALARRDLSLNIDPLAQPHVLGDARAMKFPSRSFRDVYYERIPYDVLLSNDGAALRETLRVLKPGGRVFVETGRRADIGAITAKMTQLGFRDIRAVPMAIDANGSVGYWALHAGR